MINTIVYAIFANEITSSSVLIGWPPEFYRHACTHANLDDNLIKYRWARYRV